ncbi:hypothetical protein B0H63DRAFT_529071 [Podospora didyma]|uniref:Uncharacterized protein n=1 Tax=Podospora didyma TaxID=330526 RepID=A0AAE0K279_9PEZI|nr:hypothetical protein B0H63DRAFT_529071 [Podospora didyma]
MQLSIVLAALVSLLATSVSASPDVVPGGVVEGTCTVGGNGVCNVRELHTTGGWKHKNIPCSPEKKCRSGGAKCKWRGGFAECT